MDAGRESELRAIVAALGIVFVGLLDWATGTELRVFPLYFVPISLGAWSAGPRVAQALAALASLAWVASNVVISGTAHWAILAFNSIMQTAAFVLVARLIGELGARLRREEALSRHDPLTGLPNRRDFEERAGLVLALARRQPRPLAVGVIDLDNFKAVNDTKGHDAGDEVLRAVARALAGSLRASDLVARLGGDEMVVLLPDTDAAGARQVLGRVHAAIAAAMRAGEWPVSASVGAVGCERAPPALAELVARADAVLYEAKRAGKDRVVVADPQGEPA